MKKKQNMTFGFAEILFCAISAVVLLAMNMLEARSRSARAKGAVA